MAIQIKSFNQILGNMVRKVVAETPLSDVNPGSVLLSLLEACASNDFENNVAILNVLELLSVDSLRNSDLDSKAADLGLTRRSAVTSSGSVSFYNTNIVKQSSTLYSLKPAPIAGQTVLFVNNTEGWAPSGSIYIGRGTSSFEGPITYTSITAFSTYSQLNLGAAIQNDHLASDVVINGQGQPDRIISAGTIVKIPANNQNPEILYSTVRDAVIPAGEDRVDDILVVALTPGSQGNALIGTVKQFETLPFAGATVSNTSSFSNGLDVETDAELRDRIKSYSASLARGTGSAIVSAVLGLSDPDENKRIASAVLTEPTAVGEPSILYVDDGSGFQPSFAGQSLDTLVSKAKGGEEFLQLSNYPVTRPQVVNTAQGPFEFISGTSLRVLVDGEEDAVMFDAADFINITSATVTEIVAAINQKSSKFKARLTNSSGSILLYPVDPDAETIQVAKVAVGADANDLLNFPTREVSHVVLYQNSTRLKQRAKSAMVETLPFASWSLLTDGNLIISVDGTPAQNGAFTIADFGGVSSYNLLTLENWVDAINAKFAGITAVATPGQTLRLSSNKTNSKASIQIVGGTYQAQMFGTNEINAVGQISQFELNRQTGTIRLLNPVVAGDTVTAGIADAKGFALSQSITGSVNLGTDSAGRSAQMVVVIDATKCNRIAVPVEVGQTLTVSDQGGDRTRILAYSANVFKNVQPGHYLYIANRSSWINVHNTGLFRVIARGSHLTAGTDTYVEVANDSTGLAAQTVSVADASDIAVFETDVYPQIWTTTSLPNPVSATPVDIARALNSDLRGATASVFRVNSVKLSSATEDAGSIAIPVVVGNAANLFTPASLKANESPLVGTKINTKDLIAAPKFNAIASENAYLGRAAYGLEGSSVTTATAPNSSTLYAPLSTNDLSDLVVFSGGNNKQLIRSIADQPTNSTTHIQIKSPAELFDNLPGDEVMLAQSIRLAEDDSVVCVLDNDPNVKTVGIGMARLAQVNSGSASSTFIPTTTELSANDAGNEPGIDFGSATVWGTADFSDYAILMRARNWYASGGVNGPNGKFIIRSASYGADGNKLRFAIVYPSAENQRNTLKLTNTPAYGILTCSLGSSAARVTSFAANSSVTVSGPYSSASENFPAGTATSGNFYDYTFSAGSLAAVVVGDVLSVAANSGFGSGFLGQFGVKAKSGDTIRVYNPTAAAGTQTITTPSLVNFLPLANTAVSELVTAINTSGVLVATAVGSSAQTITLSTVEELASVANSHNVGNDYVSLFDGINWVQSFQNSNPNFTLKSALSLGSNAVYSLNTAPNEDGTTGEYFKLVPTTVANLCHHLTQKALSQLPIISNVAVANDNKRIQITSRQLGSAGAVQVAGGSGNSAEVPIFGESQVSQDASGKYLLTTVPAFPSVWTAGDVVKISNPTGVKRRQVLNSGDRLSVAPVVDDMAEYYWEAKTTNFTSATSFTIMDVSSEYTDVDGNPMTSGIIWRWTHSTGASENLANVAVGDVVVAQNSGWSQGNCAKSAGENAVAGLPIIAVHDVSHSFDVVAPFGRAMASTAIGSGTVQVFATPVVQWTPAHTTPVRAASIRRSANVVTVICARDHNLNTGDSVVVLDSDVVSDATYGPVTVSSPTTFTFNSAGANGEEVDTGANVLNSIAAPIRYRLKKLGFNNLVKLEWASGGYPHFTDCGAAVDDYLVLSGTTFGSANNGVYRIVAATNTYVVFEHPNAVEVLNNVTAFNNRGLLTLWTSNSNTLIGAAGTFKYLSNGLWVKKQEDADSHYLQVVGCDTGNFTTATKVTLGGSYSGLTGYSAGLAYDQTNGHNAGVALNSLDDIVVIEGDSTRENDTMFVQALNNTNWFSPENCGQFLVTATGTDPGTNRPFVRVKNSRARAQNSVLISVASEGVYIVEGDENKYSSYRVIQRSALSDVKSTRRSVYMLPDSRQYKFSEANSTVISHLGKLNYNFEISVGTDGYSFYTGLLRRAQRMVDGYAPDASNFPERRAIGSRIEVMPPLVKNIAIALTIATKGSVLQDITSNIKSAVIDYVNGLGVGQDVILAAITARVMQVKGVAAVTLNIPSPTEERIVVSPNEKAVITADNIGIA